jgi:hypothetical protein
MSEGAKTNRERAEELAGPHHEHECAKFAGPRIACDCGDEARVAAIEKALDDKDAEWKARVETAMAERNGIISRLRSRWPHIEIPRGSVPLGQSRTYDPGPRVCLRCRIEDDIGPPWHDGMGPAR